MFGSEDLLFLVTLILNLLASENRTLGLRGVQFRIRLSTNNTQVGELYFLK